MDYERESQEESTSENGYGMVREMAVQIIVNDTGFRRRAEEYYEETHQEQCVLGREN